MAFAGSINDESAGRLIEIKPEPCYDTRSSYETVSISQPTINPKASSSNGDGEACSIKQDTTSSDSNKEEYFFKQEVYSSESSSEESVKTHDHSISIKQEDDDFKSDSDSDASGSSDSSDANNASSNNNGSISSGPSVKLESAPESSIDDEEAAKAYGYPFLPTPIAHVPTLHSADIIREANESLPSNDFTPIIYNDASGLLVEQDAVNG